MNMMNHLVALQGLVFVFSVVFFLRPPGGDHLQRMFTPNWIHGLHMLIYIYISIQSKYWINLFPYQYGSSISIQSDCTFVFLTMITYIYIYIHIKTYIAL